MKKLSRWYLLTVILMSGMTYAEVAGGEAQSATNDSGNADLLELWQDYNPWAETQAPPPPEQKPFALPRLYDDGQHFNSSIQPLQKAPKIDADSVFEAVLGCYPARSAFNAEISLVAAYRNNLETWDNDYPEISEHYVGLVGKIPLYSANERSRQREREYQIRSITAKNVASFVSAIAARNQAYRELGLYRALEARAQARVGNGIANTTEQVTYLEKLTQAHADVISQNSKIMESRLALAGLCENSKRPAINDWLKQLAHLQ